MMNTCWISVLFIAIICLLALPGLVADSSSVQGADEVIDETFLSDFDSLAYYETHPDLFKSSLNLNQHQENDNTDDKPSLDTQSRFFFDSNLARRHYWQHEARQGLPYPRMHPEDDGLQQAWRKLQHFSSSRRQEKDSGRATLVIYHLGEPDSSLSVSISHNNLLLFAQAVQQDADFTSTQFYWINVMPSKDTRNVFYEQFWRDTGLDQQWNVVLCKWQPMPSDVYTHIRTLSLLATHPQSPFNSNSESTVNLMDVFDGVFCMNHGVRGPMYGRARGSWLQPYYEVMFPVASSKSANKSLTRDEQDALNAINVGIVGSTISCEIKPHVQTHAFLLRTEVIPIILEEYSREKVSKIDNWHVLILRYEVYFSRILLEKGYQMASVFHAKRYLHHPMDFLFVDNPEKATNQTYHLYSKHGIYIDPDSCVKPIAYVTHKFYENPSTWCDYLDYEVPMMKWGGGQLRFAAYVCNDALARMQAWLSEISPTVSMPLLIPSQINNLHLKLPEIMRRPRYEVLNRDYLHEMNLPKIPAPTTTPSKGKVCFLAYAMDIDIQELKWDYTQNSNIFDREIFIAFREFLEALHRQQDPNWHVVFFRPEHSTRSTETQVRVVQALYDLIETIGGERAAFAKFDMSLGEMTLTEQIDKLLSAWTLLPSTQCAWVSVISVTTVLGSNIVHHIRQQDHSDNRNTEDDDVDVDMVLAPMDSYYFPTQKILSRRNYDHIANLNWTDMCTSIVQPMVHNSYSNLQYSTEHEMVHPELHEKLQCPLDVLEGIFFRTESIQRDFGGQNFFGNLVKEALVLDPHRSHSDLSSDPVSPSSVFLSHHLQHVQNILRHQYFWKRKMLPMEGLATAMFHLPAATWCIASGNSYFHSPNMNGQRCISVDSTRKLLDISQIVAYHEDGSVAATQFVVDNGYVSNNGHACVRLSSTFHEMLVGL